MISRRLFIIAPHWPHFPLRLSGTVRAAATRALPFAPSICLLQTASPTYDSHDIKPESYRGVKEEVSPVRTTMFIPPHADDRSLQEQQHLQTLSPTSKRRIAAFVQTLMDELRVAASFNAAQQVFSKLLALRLAVPQQFGDLLLLKCVQEKNLRLDTLITLRDAMVRRGYPETMTTFDLLLNGIENARFSLFEAQQSERDRQGESDDFVAADELFQAAYRKLTISVNRYVLKELRRAHWLAKAQRSPFHNSHLRGSSHARPSASHGRRALEAFTRARARFDLHPIVYQAAMRVAPFNSPPPPGEPDTAQEVAYTLLLDSIYRPRSNLIVRTYLKQLTEYQEEEAKKLDCHADNVARARLSAAVHVELPAVPEKAKKVTAKDKAKEKAGIAAREKGKVPVKMLRADHTPLSPLTSPLVIAGPVFNVTGKDTAAAKPFRNELDAWAASEVRQRFKQIYRPSYYADRVLMGFLTIYCDFHNQAVRSAEQPEGEAANSALPPPLYPTGQVLEAVFASLARRGDVDAVFIALCLLQRYYILPDALAAAVRSTKALFTLGHAAPSPDTPTDSSSSVSSSTDKAVATDDSADASPRVELASLVLSPRLADFDHLPAPKKRVPISHKTLQLFMCCLCGDGYSFSAQEAEFYSPTYATANPIMPPSVFCNIMGVLWEWAVPAVDATPAEQSNEFKAPPLDPVMVNCFITAVERAPEQTPCGAAGAGAQAALTLAQSFQRQGIFDTCTASLMFELQQKLKADPRSLHKTLNSIKQENPLLWIDSLLKL